MTDLIEIRESVEVIELTTGTPGATGATGPAGQGVPTGGTTGQVLAKASNTNYDTEWVDQTGGGGASAFTDLTDTPGAITASRLIAANGAGTALEFVTAANARTLLGLGTAALNDSSDFATAAQGVLASTAVQPGDLSAVATSGDYDDLLNTPTLFSGAYADLTGVPTTFAPSAHTHTLADVTDAGTAAAADTGDFEAAGAVSTHAAATSGVHGISAFGATLVDDANAGAARTTLGLGSAATQDTGDFAAASHTHTALQVTDFSTAADARIAAASIGDLSDIDLTGAAANRILEMDAGGTFRLIATPTSSGTPTWGGITGVLSNQTDLQSALDGKADSSHTHTASEVTDFSTAADARIAAADLGDLADVTISGSQTTRFVVGWTGGGWADVNVDTLIATYLGGTAEFTDLSDVTIFSPVAGEVPRWNGAGWVNAQLAYSDLSGTPSLATVATSGDYNDLANLPTLFSGAYGDLTGVPATFPPSSHALSSHNDVTISLITAGHFLRWNGSAWLNTALGTGDIPNLAASKITSGTFADARISQSSVTQHAAALPILGSQVSGKQGPGASFDGGGAAITDGVIVRSPVTEAGTVSAVYAVADQSGSVSVIVRRYAAADTSFASPTVLGTLTISTAQVGTLGSLSQAVAVGDVLEFEIDGAATNIQRLAVRARI